MLQCQQLTQEIFCYHSQHCYQFSYQCHQFSYLYLSLRTFLCVTNVTMSHDSLSSSTASRVLQLCLAGDIDLALTNGYICVLSEKLNWAVALNIFSSSCVFNVKSYPSSLNVIHAFLYTGIYHESCHNFRQIISAQSLNIEN